MLWNTSIEVVQAWRAWYFCHVKALIKVREGVEKPYLCMGVPEDSEHEKE